MSFRGTTILTVIKDGVIAMGGDGQVTLGDHIIKTKAIKIRKIADHNILGGFAGHTADAFTLFERFETRLEKASGNMAKAAIELAREWRMDKALRQLQAMLLIGNRDKILMISGQGDVLEPDEQVASIGSGSVSAQAAARALLRNTSLDAETIVRKSLEIAAEQCIYTNSEICMEVLGNV